MVFTHLFGTRKKSRKQTRLYTVNVTWLTDRSYEKRRTHRVPSRANCSTVLPRSWKVELMRCMSTYIRNAVWTGARESTKQYYTVQCVRLEGTFRGTRRRRRRRVRVCVRSTIDGSVLIWPCIMTYIVRDIYTRYAFVNGISAEKDKWMIVYTGWRADFVVRILFAGRRVYVCAGWKT